MFRITRDPSSGSFILAVYTHMHHGVSPILYIHYISFLYMSCCFGINLILNQTPNLYLITATMLP